MNMAKNLMYIERNYICNRNLKHMTLFTTPVH